MGGEIKISKPVTLKATREEVYEFFPLRNRKSEREAESLLFIDKSKAGIWKTEAQRERIFNTIWRAHKTQLRSRSVIELTGLSEDGAFSYEFYEGKKRVYKTVVDEKPTHKEYEFFPIKVRAESQEEIRMGSLLFIERNKINWKSDRERDRVFSAIWEEENEYIADRSQIELMSFISGVCSYTFLEKGVPIQNKVDLNTYNPKPLSAHLEVHRSVATRVDELTLRQFEQIQLGHEILEFLKAAIALLATPFIYIYQLLAGSGEVRDFARMLAPIQHDRVGEINQEVILSQLRFVGQLLHEEDPTDYNEVGEARIDEQVLHYSGQNRPCRVTKKGYKLWMDELEYHDNGKICREREKGSIKLRVDGTYNLDSSLLWGGGSVKTEFDNATKKNVPTLSKKIMLYNDTLDEEYRIDIFGFPDPNGVMRVNVKNQTVESLMVPNSQVWLPIDSTWTPREIYSGWESQSGMVAWFDIELHKSLTPPGWVEIAKGDAHYGGWGAHDMTLHLEPEEFIRLVSELERQNAPIESDMQKMGNCLLEGSAIGMEMLEALNSGDLTKAGEIIAYLEERLSGLPQNKQLLIPIAQGEGSSYIPHFLLFIHQDAGSVSAKYGGVREVVKERVWLKHVSLSSTSLEKGEMEVVTTYDFTDTIGNAEKRGEFARRLFYAQPHKRSKDVEDVKRKGPLEADSTLEDFLALYGTCTGEGGVRKHSSRDPVKAIYTTIQELRLEKGSDAEMLQRQKERLIDEDQKLERVIASKGRFFSVYVNHLVTYYAENEHKLMPVERVRALDGILWYAKKVYDYVKSEVNAKTASAISGHLIEFVETKLAELKRTERLEQQDISNLENKVNLFNASLSEDFREILKFNQPTKEVADTSVDAIAWASIEAIQLEFTECAEVVASDENIVIRKSPDRVLHLFKQEVKRATFYLEQGRPLAAKRVLLALMKTLPPATSPKGDETFWEKLNEEELTSWLKTLEKLAGRMFSAQLCSKIDPLVPFEGFEFSIMLPLLTRYLFSLKIDFKSKEFWADQGVIKTYHTNRQIRADLESARLDFTAKRETELTNIATRKCEATWKEEDKADKEAKKVYDAKLETYNRLREKYNAYKSQNHPVVADPGPTPPDIRSLRQKRTPAQKEIDRKTELAAALKEARTQAEKKYRGDLDLEVLVQREQVATKNRCEAAWAQEDREAAEAEKKYKENLAAHQVRSNNYRLYMLNRVVDPGAAPKDERTEKQKRTEEQKKSDRKIELAKAIIDAQKADEYLNTLKAVDVTTLCHNWHLYTKHPLPRIQAVMGAFAKIMGIPKELYAYELGKQAWILLSFKEMSESDFWLMMGNCTILTDPALEYRHEAAKHTFGVLRNKRDTFQIPLNFLIGYEGRGEGTQYICDSDDNPDTIWSLAERGVAEIKKDLFAAEIALHMLGYFNGNNGSEFLVPAEVSQVCKLDEMRKILRDPLKHLKKYYDGLMGAAYESIFDDDLTEAYLENEIASMRSIHLVAPDSIFTGNCFTLSGSPTGTGNLCTNGESEKPSTFEEGKNYVGELTAKRAAHKVESDGERKVLEEIATESNQSKFKESRIKEFVLRTTTLLESGGEVSYLSVTACFDYIYQYPLDIVEPGIRDTLHKTLLQRELIKKSLLKNPDYFMRLGPQLQKICTFLEPQTPHKLSALFVREMGERVRRQAFELEEEYPNWTYSASISRALPAYDTENVVKVCMGNFDRPEQKAFATYVLSYYCHKASDGIDQNDSDPQKTFALSSNDPNQFPSPRDIDAWRNLLNAFCILKRSAVKIGHTGMQEELAYKVEHFLLPYIWREMKKDSRLCNNLLEQLTGHAGPWRAHLKKSYIFTLQDSTGAKREANIHSGEGFKIDVAPGQRVNLPLVIRNNPSYKFLFKKEDPLVQSFKGEGDVSKYTWKDKERKMEFQFCYHADKNHLQIYQIVQGEKYQFQHLTLAQSNASKLRQLMAQHDNRTVEDLIRKKGVWIAMTAEETLDISRIILPQHGWNLQKDPINLTISGDKITGATLGTGSNKKWICSGLTDMDSQLLSFRGGSRLFLLSKDGIHVDEIRFPIEDIGGEQLVLKRREKDSTLWVVVGREDWVWQLTNTKTYEDQYGKDWREFLLILKNQVTLAEEILIFPHPIMEGGKRGEKVQLLKSAAPIVDAAGGYLTQTGRVDGATVDRLKMVAKGIEAFAGAGRIGEGIENLVGGQLDEGARFLLNLAKKLGSPRALRYYKQGGSENSSYAGFLYLALQAATRRDWGRASRSMQLMVEKGTSNREEVRRLQEIVVSLFGTDVLMSGDVEKGVKNFLASQSPYENVFRAKLVAALLLVKDRLQTQLGVNFFSIGDLLPPNSGLNEARFTAIIETAGAGFYLEYRRALGDPDNSYYSRFQDCGMLLNPQEEKILSAEIVLLGLSEVTKQKLINEPTVLSPPQQVDKGARQEEAWTSFRNNEFVAKKLEDFDNEAETKLRETFLIFLESTDFDEARDTFTVHITEEIVKIAKKNTQYSESLILWYVKSEVVKIIPIITPIYQKYHQVQAPVVKALVVSKHAPFQLEQPSEEELRQLTNAIADHIKPEGVWSIHHLHTQVGSFPKWETLLAHFWSYWEWIDKNDPKIEIEELEFLRHEIPLNEPYRAEIHTARCVLILFWYYSKSPLYEGQREQLDLDHAGNVRDIKSKRLDMIDMADLVETQTRLQQEQEMSPSLFGGFYAALYPEYVKILRLVSELTYVEKVGGVDHKRGVRKDFVQLSNVLLLKLNKLWKVPHNEKHVGERKRITAKPPTSLERAKERAWNEFTQIPLVELLLEERGDPQLLSMIQLAFNAFLDLPNFEEAWNKLIGLLDTQNLKQRWKGVLDDEMLKQIPNIPPDIVSLLLITLEEAQQDSAGIHKAYVEAVGLPKFSYPRAVKEASYEEVEVRQPPTRQEWNKYFMKNSYYHKIWDGRRDIAKEKYFNVANIPPEETHARHKLEQRCLAFDKAVEDLKKRTGSSCRVADLEIIFKEVSRNLKLLHAAHYDLRGKILDFSRTHSTELGMIHLYADPERVTDEQIIQHLFGLYEWGEISLLEDLTLQTYFAELITEYILVTTELQQHEKAKKTCKKNLIPLKKEILVKIPQSIQGSERATVAQAEANRAPDWVLHSSELQRFLEQGADRLRYTQERGGHYYLRDQNFTRRYLVKDIEKGWVARPLAISALEDMLKDMRLHEARGEPVRFIKAKMGMGKSDFIFVNAFDMAIQAGYAVNMITTSDLVPQQQVSMGSKVFVFQFTIDFGLDLVHKQELDRLDGVRREEIEKEDGNSVIQVEKLSEREERLKQLMTPEAIEAHLEGLIKVLNSLKVQRKGVLTSPQDIAFLRNKRVQLQTMLEMMNPGPERSAIFRQVELLKKIEGYFKQKNALYFIDEDRNYDIGFEYNFATGEFRTVDPIRFDVAEHLFRTIHDHHPQLWSLIISNNLRAIQDVSKEFREVVRTLFRDHRFWKTVGWDIDLWKTINEEKFINFILKVNQPLPTGKFTFDIQNPLLKAIQKLFPPLWKEIIALRDPDTKSVSINLLEKVHALFNNKEYRASLGWKSESWKTIKENDFVDFILGTRPDLPTALPEWNTALSEDQQPEKSYVAALKTFLSETMGSVHGINPHTERASIGARVGPAKDGVPQKDTIFGEESENILQHLSHYTGIGNKIDESIFMQKEKELSGLEYPPISPHYPETWKSWSNKIGDVKDRKKEYQSRHQALENDPELVLEKIQYLRHIMLQTDYVPVYKRQFTFNSQELGVGVEIRLGSGTGDDYSLNLPGDSINIDTILAETILCMDLDQEVTTYSDPLTHIRKQAKNPQCCAVINYDAVAMGNDSEKIVEMLRQDAKRQYVYRDNELNKKIWNKGEHSSPMSYEPEALTEDVFGVLMVKDCRGVHIEFPRGGNKHGNAMFGIGNLEDDAAQTMCRLRHLGLGHEIKISIDEKAPKLIRTLFGLGEKERVNVGHVMYYFFHNTLKEEEVKGLKATIFKTQTPLRTHLDAAIREPYDLTEIEETTCLEDLEGKVVARANGNLYILINTLSKMREYQPRTTSKPIPFMEGLYVSELKKIEEMEGEFEAQLKELLKVHQLGKFSTIFGWANQVISNQIQAFEALLDFENRPSQKEVDFFEGLSQSDKDLLASFLGTIELIEPKPPVGYEPINVRQAVVQKLQSYSGKEAALMREIMCKYIDIRLGYGKARAAIHVEQHKLKHDKEYQEYICKHLQSDIPDDPERGNRAEQKVQQLQKQKMNQLQKKIEKVLIPRAIDTPTKPLNFKKFIAKTDPSYEWQEKISRSRWDMSWWKHEGFFCSLWGFSGVRFPDLNNSTLHVSMRAGTLLDAMGRSGAPSFDILMVERQGRFHSVIVTKQDHVGSVAEALFAERALTTPQVYFELGNSATEQATFNTKTREAYKALGLKKGATYTQIKAAYTKLARAYHPDKTNDDPEKQEKFKKITDAFRHLEKTPEVIRFKEGNRPLFQAPTFKVGLYGLSNDQYPPNEHSSYLVKDEAGAVNEHHPEFIRLMVMNKLFLNWEKFTTPELDFLIDYIQKLDRVSFLFLCINLRERSPNIVTYIEGIKADDPQWNLIVAQRKLDENYAGAYRESEMKALIKWIRKLKTQGVEYYKKEKWFKDTDAKHSLKVLKEINHHLEANNQESSSTSEEDPITPKKSVKVVRTHTIKVESYLSSEESSDIDTDESYAGSNSDEFSDEFSED